MTDKSLLRNAIANAKAAATLLITSLEIIEATLISEAEQLACEHKRQRDLSSMGTKRWQCLDCRHIHQEEFKEA